MADRSQFLNDPEQALRLALDGRQSTMWTALPGIITKVDLANQTLEVQPAIQGIIENESGAQQYVNLPILLDVPIVFPSGGGFLITFPLAVGDEVLVVFASRCIDAWWASGKTSKAPEFRMHDLSDGFAIPGPRSQPKKASGVSTSNLQIRNNAGTVYVEIRADGKIKLVSTGDMELTAPNVKINGDLKVTGEVTGNSATVPINLTTHTHTSGTPGNPTSPPLP